MKASSPPRGVRREWCSGAEPAAEPEPQPELCCLQLDMKHCYSRLRRLVPTIPQDRRVSRVEILQHVIDYILDLQLALERSDHHRATWPPQSRAPLSALNSTEQRTPAISKTEDSILCR